MRHFRSAVQPPGVPATGTDRDPRQSGPGARIQSRLPDLLIRRVMGVLVLAIGIRYLLLAAS